MNGYALFGGLFEIGEGNIRDNKYYLVRYLNKLL